MSDKHLQRNAHRVRGDKDAWWYEDVKGIDVCVQRDGAGRTVIVHIPWRYLKSAIARKERP